MFFDYKLKDFFLILTYYFDRVFDKRVLVNEQKVLKTFTPTHMVLKSPISSKNKHFRLNLFYFLRLQKDLNTQRCSVTSAVYNHNGSGKLIWTSNFNLIQVNKLTSCIFIQEIIASYSDDDIYLFESEQDETKDAKYRYSGHRNSDTSKKNSFFI